MNDKFTFINLNGKITFLIDNFEYQIILHIFAPEMRKGLLVGDKSPLFYWKIK